MRHPKTILSACLLTLTMAMTLPSSAFEPAGKPQPGIIRLKGGEELQGLISPLGKFADAGTVFIAEQTKKKILVAHSQVEEVTVNGQSFQPMTVPVNGKPTPAYAEKQVSGPATLYKAHYYAPRSFGKNNTSTQLQWSWVLHTSHFGLVSLGQHPKRSAIQQWLDHPLLTDIPQQGPLDEQGLLETISGYNEAVRSVMTGIPNEEMKNDR